MIIKILCWELAWCCEALSQRTHITLMSVVSHERWWNDWTKLPTDGQDNERSSCSQCWLSLIDRLQWQSNKQRIPRCSGRPVRCQTFGQIAPALKFHWAPAAAHVLNHSSHNGHWACVEQSVIRDEFAASATRCPFAHISRPLSHKLLISRPSVWFGQAPSNDFDVWKGSIVRYRRRRATDVIFVNTT